MLGDAEHPISFLWEAERRGEHVHVTVRAGLRPNGQGGGGRALCGTLVMRSEEWALLRSILVATPEGIQEDARRFVARLRDAIPADAQSDPSLDPWGRALVEGVRLVYLDTSPFEVHGFPELADERGVPRA